MCGRYTLSNPGDLFEEELGTLLSEDQELPEIEPLYNICPTDSSPIIRTNSRSHDHGNELVMARWGLVPWWAKTPSIGARHINARAETVAASRVFGKAFEKRRCLVPASGFFEWQRGPEGKRPIHIQQPSRRIVAFAGLWERWRGPSESLSSASDGIDSFTILTTNPTKKLAAVHDRMPVILPPSAFELWLDHGEKDSTVLLRLLVPFAGDLDLIPVGTAVNNVRNKSADCLMPELGEALGQLQIDS